jgi:hypothetical protein
MPRISPVRIPWPLRGINRNFGFQGQPGGTTPDALNVRSIDPVSGRSRGAQRAGLTRYLDGELTASSPIQCLDHATIAAGYTGATTLNTRTIYQVAVAAGNVALFTAGTTFTMAASGTGALSATAPVIHSAELFGKVYFADGTSQKLWDAATNAVQAWTLTAGTFPQSGANKPRGICMWRSRIVLWGLVGDDHNYFMSAVGLPLDFDYFPADVTQAIAVAGNLSVAGRIGDVINCMIPASDELMIVGCDHSIWIIHGDPAAGGSATQLSTVTGMAFGAPYCIDAFGNVWFMGSRGGVYRMSSGGGIPERVTTDSIDDDLADLDLSTTLVKMAWDDRHQGVHLFLTQLDGDEATHFYLDTTNQGWWADRFASTDLDPTAVHVFDGDDPSDRVILLGCRDSRVRYIDLAAKHDDGHCIDSYVFLGPIRTNKPMTRVMLRELQGTLASESGQVGYDLLAGVSVEAAVTSATPLFSGTWYGGRNPGDLRGGRGDALFLRLRSQGEAWSVENIDGRLELLGSEAQRSLV